MPLHIAIVDDKPSNRKMIAEKLAVHPFFEVAFTAGDGKNFLDQMGRCEMLPEIVLMDLEMPRMDGVAAIAAGSALYPSVKFVVLTIFDDEDRIFKAIKAGAHGYLLKEASPTGLADALLAMHECGGGAISPGIAHLVLNLVRGDDKQAKPAFDENFFRLTERETEILKLLAEGLGYKELGTRLGISPNTAKKHVISVYDKLHVHTRAQALRLAYEKGML